MCCTPWYPAIYHFRPSTVRMHRDFVASVRRLTSSMYYLLAWLALTLVEPSNIPTRIRATLPHVKDKWILRPRQLRSWANTHFGNNSLYFVPGTSRPAPRPPWRGGHDALLHGPRMSCRRGDSRFSQLRSCRSSISDFSGQIYAGIFHSPWRFPCRRGTESLSLPHSYLCM